MIGLVPVFLGFAAGGLNLIINRLRPDFSFRWVINLFSALVILIAGLIAGFLSPQPVDLQIWGVGGSSVLSLAFRFDPVTWIFSIGIGFFLLLTTIAHPASSGPQRVRGQAAAFFVSAALLLLAAAANLVGMAVGWVILDLALSAYELSDRSSIEASRLGISPLIVRLVSVFLLLLGLYLPGDLGDLNQPPGISMWQSVLVLLAVGVRTGVFAPRWIIQYWQQSGSPDLPGNQLLLFASAGISGLIVLSRLPAETFPTYIAAPGVAFTLLAVGVATLTLLWSEEFTVRLPAVFILFSALAFTSALYSQVEAVLAWSIAGLFSGGLLQHLQSSTRLNRIGVVLVLISGLGLPFTPTWAGTNLYSQPGSLFAILFLIPHSLMTVNLFSRHSPGENFNRDLNDLQRLLRSIFVTLLLAVYLALGVWGALNAGWRGNWWSGAFILVFAVIIYLLWRRLRPPWFENPPDFWLNLAPFNWLPNTVRVIFRPVSRAFNLFNSIIEGESGILWSMLILVILLSLLATLVQG